MSRTDASPALRWTVYGAIAVVFAIACGFLAQWQFARNEERSTQLRFVAENYDAAPVSLEDVIAPGDELAPSHEWTPVELTGTYLPDEQLLVRNRAHGGTSAFEVLVPFRAEDGRVLLIDRGWVPPGDPDPLPDEIPAPPEGEVTVIVRLRPGEAEPTSGRSAEEGQLPTISLPLAAERIASGDDLETGAYGLMVSEDPAPATVPGTISPPSEDPGPHLSYAIQWILFAVMGGVFIAYVIVSERRHRREDAAEDAASASPAAPAPAKVTSPAVTAHRRRRRARDRDAEDEDALLDSPR